MVGGTVVTALVLNMFITIGMPILLLTVGRKKYRISFKVVLFGMLTFILFAVVLEQLAHFFFFSVNGTTQKWLENPWVYMLYGGLMAGIFEETGRFIVFAYMLKKYREWKDGFAFGIGHGGIESVMLVGINSVVMIVFAIMINNGSFDALIVNEQSRGAMDLVRTQLTDTSPLLILMGGLERLSAIILHISLSILVLYALKSKKMAYFFLAILIHAAFDFPAALYQKGVIGNIYMVEAIILLFAAAMAVWIVKARAKFVA